MVIICSCGVSALLLSSSIKISSAKCWWRNPQKIPFTAVSDVASFSFSIEIDRRTFFSSVSQSSSTVGFAKQIFLCSLSTVAPIPSSIIDLKTWYGVSLLWPLLEMLRVLYPLAASLLS